MIVTGARAAEFAVFKLGRALVEPYETIGVTRNGAVVAAMVFDHLSGPDIHVTVVSSGSLPRRLIRAAGDYVFRQLGCDRATLITESPVVYNYGLRLGARLECVRASQYGSGRPGYQMAFFRDGWRF